MSFLCSFILFTLKDLKKVVFLIPFAALRTSAIHATPKPFRKCKFSLYKLCEIQAVVGENLSHSIVICAHFNSIYTGAYIMVVVICKYMLLRV